MRTKRDLILEGLLYNRLKESADLDSCVICYGSVNFNEPDSYCYPDGGNYEGELCHTRCLKRIGQGNYCKSKEDGNKVTLNKNAVTLSKNKKADYSKDFDITPEEKVKGAYTVKDRKTGIKYFVHPFVRDTYNIAYVTSLSSIDIFSIREMDKVENIHSLEDALNFIKKNFRKKDGLHLYATYDAGYQRCASAYKETMKIFPEMRKYIVLDMSNNKELSMKNIIFECPSCGQTIKISKRCKYCGQTFDYGF